MASRKRSANEAAESSSGLRSPAIAAAQAALRNALAANLSLQAGLLEKLEKVASLKAANRRTARLASTSLLCRWEADDVREREKNSFRPMDQKDLKRLLEKERRRREWVRYEAERSIIGERGSDEDDDSEDDSSSKPSAPVPTVAQMTRRWSYDEGRRWTRRYFVDPDGSVPDRGENEIHDENEDDRIPALHRCRPWCEEEVKGLKLSAEKVRQEQMCQEMRSATSDDGRDSGKGKAGGEGGCIGVPDAEIDFEKVASLVNEVVLDGKKGATSRSAAECRSKFLVESDSIDKSDLSADESLKVSEMVRLHGDRPPPWDAVAASIGPGRTPWQCFRDHISRRQLESMSSRPWAPEEDELLFKYIAAHGPEFLFNLTGATSDAASRLFPDRTPQQLMLRASASLLNPNYKNETWSDEEERRLALCMRVYRDAKSPLTRTYVHFPDRASKSVCEKWVRSLNPEIVFKPFTKKEDRILLQAIKEMGGPDSCSWVQVTRQHFPSRNPRSIKYRWMELASDEELARKYSKKPRTTA